MIGQVIAGIIVITIIFLIVASYLGMKMTWIEKWLAAITMGDENMREDAMQLISTGSSMGIGIGLLASYMFGTSLIVAMIFIAIGLYSAKKNWYLVKQ